MVTAILVVTALVIAVVIYIVGIGLGYILLRIIDNNSPKELQEAIKWAKLWDEQRAKDICDSDCLWCSNNQFCKLKDAQ